MPKSGGYMCAKESDSLRQKGRAVALSGAFGPQESLTMAAPQAVQGVVQGVRDVVHNSFYLPQHSVSHHSLQWSQPGPHD